MKIGFTAGSFDLFHVGHVMMLKECREHCDRLIVGIQVNPQIDRKEKHKPIQSVLERQIIVGSCRFVDEIIVYETEKDLESILKTLPINIRFIGADHEHKEITGADICDDLDIEIFWNTREHDFSSSELRERIKNAKN